MEEISGNLIFQNHSAINDFSGFANLKRIIGSLNVTTTDFRNFSGFQNLQFIGEDFIIEDCNSIQNFTGLENLQSIGHDFKIKRNTNLENFTGLSDLEIIDNTFEISQNENLVNFKGLASLEIIRENITISDNDILTDLTGLGHLKYTEKNFVIEFNRELGKLTGLNNLDSIGGYFSIYENRKIEDFTGLENLKKVAEDFNVNSMAAVKSFHGLENLKSIGLGFNIIENPILENLEGLNNLKSAQSLDVVGNNSLTDFGGLGNLTTLSVGLNIENNPGLTSIAEMNSIKINDRLNLSITNNPQLSFCSSLSFCEFVEQYEYNSESFWWELNWNIFGNKVGCNNFPEIYVGCSPTRCLPNDIFLKNQAEVDEFIQRFPNCTEIYGQLKIQDENITNVDSLINLDSLRGGLIIRAANLQNLNGLNSLIKVDKNVNFYGNNSLKSFQGLENLKSVGSLSISQNPKITNLNGLNGIEILTDEDGDLVISSNNSLNSLEGLDNLMEIQGVIRLEDLDRLLDINGFPNLEILGRGIDFSNGWYGSDISGFPKLKIIRDDLILGGRLTNVSGLNELTKIEGNVYLEGIGSQSGIIITGLQKLDTVGRDFIFSNLSGAEFNGFNQLKHIGGDFMCMDPGTLNRVNGFENLRSIGGSFYIMEAFDILELNAFQNLKDIGKDFYFGNSYNLENLNNFSSLRNIHGRFTLEGHELITDISGLSNINFFRLNELHLKFNYELSTCNIPFVCNFLLNGGTADVNFNAPGCFDREEVESGCDLSYGKLRYGTFFDENQNGIHEHNEPLYSDGLVFLKPFEFLLSANPDSLGRIKLPEGNYQTEHYSLAGWKLTSANNSVNIILNDTITCDTVLFGIYPELPVSGSTAFINTPPTRCNEQTEFTVSGKNTGTSVLDGMLWLRISPDVDFPDFIDSPDSTILPTLFGWNFENLFPGEIVEKKLYLTIPGPPDFLPGDSLHFESFLRNTDANGIFESEHFVYKPVVRCSYDPNDKIVNPSRTGNYTLFDEDLIYTIRFQNTGNDVALNVSVRDTLDQKLDPATFRILNSSHYEILNTQIENDRFITFEFENINLPDSTLDFKGSNGFVSYKISPFSGIPEMTPIFNTASIYFDFNPPIVTNTTESIMVSELPTSSTQNTENQLLIHVFPNPTTGYIFIKGNNLKNAKITLTDLTGRILKQEKLNERQEVSLPETAQGMFFLKVETEEGTLVKRVIKI